MQRDEANCGEGEEGEGWRLTRNSGKLKTLQRHFMDGVALSLRDYPRYVHGSPARQNANLRPANLPGASVRSGPIGGDCGLSRG